MDPVHHDRAEGVLEILPHTAGLHFDHLRLERGRMGCHDFLRASEGRPCHVPPQLRG